MPRTPVAVPSAVFTVRRYSSPSTGTSVSVAPDCLPGTVTSLVKGLAVSRLRTSTVTGRRSASGDHVAFSVPSGAALAVTSAGAVDRSNDTVAGLLRVPSGPTATSLIVPEVAVKRLT